MRTYQLYLEDGSSTTMWVNEEVTNIETEIAKMGGQLMRPIVEGYPETGEKAVKITGYQVVS